MTISGETIDYGPCAFMEAYDPAGGVQLDRPPGPLRLRQPAGDRALEPGAAGRDAAAADRRDDADAGASRRRLQVHRRLPGAVPARAAARASAPSSGWSAPTRGRRRGRRGAGRRLAGAAARARVDFTLGLAPPGRRGRRRRGAAARAVRAMPRRPTPGWRAGASAAPATTPRRGRTATAAGRRAPSACAASTRGSSRATTASRRRSPPPPTDGDLAPFERLLAALRRPYDEPPEHAPYAEPAPAAVTACYRPSAAPESRPLPRGERRPFARATARFRTFTPGPAGVGRPTSAAPRPRDPHGFETVFGMRRKTHHRLLAMRGEGLQRLRLVQRARKPGLRQHRIAVHVLRRRRPLQLLRVLRGQAQCSSCYGSGSVYEPDPPAGPDFASGMFAGAAAAVGATHPRTPSPSPASSGGGRRSHGHQDFGDTFASFDEVEPEKPAARPVAKARPKGLARTWWMVCAAVLAAAVYAQQRIPVQPRQRASVGPVPEGRRPGVPVPVPAKPVKRPKKSNAAGHGSH